MTKKKVKTNPNGVNQYTDPDPRQTLFLNNYLNPKSKTFSNAYQSAIDAGYSKEYAENILNVGADWLSERKGSDKYSKMLEKAERNLDEFLEMPVNVLALEGKGEDAEMVVKTDPALVRIKQDTTKFVSSRLGKDRWSERREVTGPNGDPIELEMAEKKKIDELFAKNN